MVRAMSTRDEAPEKTLDRIIGERREKAAALRGHGSDPFRNDLGPSVAIADVRARYDKTKPAEPPAGKGITPVDDHVHRVAGRVMAKRDAGKLMFAPIRDGHADIQLYLSLDHLAADDFANILPQLDIGDHVVAEGPVFWTKRGEMSILVKRLWIVTKSLRPLPDKWHGMTDVELRYRQRYVDLAISPDVREVFRRRSTIVRGIRSFMDRRGYMEVETPMMHSILGGAAARPFKTHHNALGIDLYMRIAPELFLKRLVVGGFERVYEINRNFRNEGIDRQHNPEFTMLEFYQAYAQYTDLMDLTEQMFVELAREVAGGTRLVWDGTELDLSPPWRRLTIRAAVRELGGIAEADRVFDDPDFAATVALAHGVSPKDVQQVKLGAMPGETALDRRVRAGHLGYLLFEQVAEAKLVQPTFLTEFPLAVSPLARKNDRDPAFCDRFELFVRGVELANGFSELNDPDDQRARFQAQLRAKAAGAEETMEYDEDYCRALEIGLPPTAGEGIGIDRLVMMLTGQPSIRDVLLFPLLRPE
jgi:lysyl-tRNA synthetase class 2